MSFIEISINHSFNKNKNRQTDVVPAVKSNSTLSGNHVNNVEISSTNISSLTNSAINNQVGNIVSSDKRKTIVREFFILVASSFITYAIIHFFNLN